MNSTGLTEETEGLEEEQDVPGNTLSKGNPSHFFAGERLTCLCCYSKRHSTAVIFLVVQRLRHAPVMFLNCARVTRVRLPARESFESFLQKFRGSIGDSRTRGVATFEPFPFVSVHFIGYC